MQSQEVTWGDASPTLMFGLGTALVPLGLFAAGQIPLEAGPIIGAWLLGLMLSNLICGIIALRRGDTLFGSLAIYFGTMLAAAGGFSSLLHTGWLLGGQTAFIPLQYEGWSWLCTGVALLLFVPSLARVSWSLVLSCLVVGVGLILFGLAYVSGMAWITVAVVGGWMIFAFAIYCFYAGLVILTNAIYAKEVLPLGRPLVK